MMGFSTGLDLIPDFWRPFCLDLAALSLGCLLLLNGPAAILVGVGCRVGILAVQRKVAESTASCDSRGLPTGAATTRVQRPPVSEATSESGIWTQQPLVGLGCLLLLLNRLLRFGFPPRAPGEALRGLDFWSDFGPDFSPELLDFRANCSLVRCLNVQPSPLSHFPVLRKE